MSLLATAGACLALVAALLFILYLFSGQGFVLLIAIFPAILAKNQLFGICNSEAR